MTAAREGSRFRAPQRAGSLDRPGIKGRVPEKPQNTFEPEHVEHIYELNRGYKDVPGEARVVTLDEIAANDHNLNTRSTSSLTVLLKKEGILK